MLVLSRKSDESLIIAGEIVVTILGIEGDRVKLGITAPPEVVILRQEVRDRRARRRPAPPPGAAERA
jgi:carbon storage regulator